MKVPNTYVIIFSVLLLCAVATWFIPGGAPQTWQVFSALFEGFSQQAGIIAFVLIIGGAFWIVNSTKAVDAGITRFISKVSTLERFSPIRKLGIGNIVIVLVMLLFGVFGAVFGMSEETIAFVAVVIPLAKSLGYDEIVEAKGTSLSGGQKQRLSIARAIIKKPEILIFDDSTSALDLVTESKLHEAMKKHLSHVTKIIVAQRIGTIMNADKIIVLEKGSVVGEGTHNELMKNCSVYKEIALSQLSKEELKNA